MAVVALIALIVVLTLIGISICWNLCQRRSTSFLIAFYCVGWKTWRQLHNRTTLDIADQIPQTPLNKSTSEPSHSEEKQCRACISMSGGVGKMMAYRTYRTTIHFMNLMEISLSSRSILGWRVLSGWTVLFKPGHWTECLFTGGIG
jgi:hypothetical protein